MINTFAIKSSKKNDLFTKSTKTLDYGLFIYENLINSKTFWITSIYLFLSITLLTGVHMYEFFKCFLC